MLPQDRSVIINGCEYTTGLIPPWQLPDAGGIEARLSGTIVKPVRFGRVHGRGWLRMGFCYVVCLYVRLLLGNGDRNFEVLG